MAKTSFGTTDIYKVSVGGLYNITKISIGDELVYTAGNTVTYYVDTNVIKTEEVDADETVLSPKSFSPEKTGWQFVGWRLDGQANSSVETNLYMGDNPITLYAVYKKTITLSYNSNSGTGSMSSQSGIRYFNAYGNYADPSFTLSANGFSRAHYNFVRWRMGGASGTAYNAGAKVTLQDSTVFYAEWALASHTVTYIYNGAKATRTVAYGNSVLSPGISPALSGCSFLGWTNNQNSASALTSLDMGDSDITLWAVWRASNLNLTANKNNTYREADHVRAGTPLDDLAFTNNIDTSMYSGVFINAVQIFASYDRLFRGDSYAFQLYVSDGTVGTIVSLTKGWYPVDGSYTATISTGYGLKYVVVSNGASIANQSFTVNFNTKNISSAKIYWRITCLSGEEVHGPSVAPNVSTCYLVGRQFAR